MTKSTDLRVSSAQHELRLSFLLVLAIATFADCASARQTLQRASATSVNVPIGTGAQAISWDGRFVLFVQNANLFVMPPTPSNGQIYRRELSTGNFDLVTIDLSGNVTLQSNLYNDMTRDGRLIAFASREDDLVANDGNGQTADVFLRDMSTGITELISAAWNGGPANDESIFSALSADARYVAYVSSASNIVLLDTNNCMDLFVYDRTLQVTERVNVSTAGREANYGSLCWIPNIFNPLAGVDISQDGRYVVFGCIADNLVPNDTNQRHDVFIRDRLAGTTTLLVQPSGGTAALGTGGFGLVSDDGRIAALYTRAHELIPGAAAFPGWQIVACDLVNGGCQVVSIDAAGQPHNGYPLSMCMSSDGRYVGFSSDDDNILPGDTNGQYDAYVRDLQANSTARLSNSMITGAAANNGSLIGGMSGDGKLVLMDSGATDMVAGNVPGGAAVVVLDRALNSVPIVTYCTGKTNSQGCLPAIAPLGLPSIGGKYAFFVTALNVLNQRKGGLVWSMASAQAPFMGGTLCVRPPLRATAPQDSNGNPGNGNDCTGWQSFRMTPAWMQALGWTAGTTIYCQYFCRDPAFSAPDQLAFTEGLRFTVVP